MLLPRQSACVDLHYLYEELSFIKNTSWSPMISFCNDVLVVGTNFVDEYEVEAGEVSARRQI